MTPLLKKAIVLHILDNLTEFQIITHAVNQFRPYIYDDKGDYLIGGEEVHKFVFDACLFLS